MRRDAGVDAKVRNYILQQLEDSKLKGGDKLLAARSIAREVGVSFLKVQQAVDALANDGVLKIAPRRGAFVRKNWKERILQTNLCLYNAELPWVEALRRVLDERLPGLRLASAFTGGVFELTTTLKAQMNSGEYMDLTDIFNRLYPDQSDFYERPFETLKVGGELRGIPFVFSPRVVFHNPKLFAKAGCVEPRPGWTWEDLMTCVRKLKKILPRDNVFEWNLKSYYWLNFLLRAGGCLLDPTSENPVRIDHPKTRRGIQLLADLRDELGVEHENPDFHREFLAGDAAFLVAPRQFMTFIEESGFRDWSVAPLPLIDGGKDLNVQATDLLCVRKSCADDEMAEAFVETMLSEEVQDLVAKARYGIPIRKSSASKSIDLDDPRDTLFMAEASKMTAEYNLDSPDISMLIQDGIKQIWQEREDVEKASSELANAVRTFLKIRRGARRPLIRHENI